MFKIAYCAGHYRYTAGKRLPKELDKNETREWVLNDRVARYFADYTIPRTAMQDYPIRNCPISVMFISIITSGFLKSRRYTPTPMGQ